MGQIMWNWICSFLKRDYFFYLGIYGIELWPLGLNVALFPAPPLNWCLWFKINSESRFVTSSGTRVTPGWKVCRLTAFASVNRWNPIGLESLFKRWNPSWFCFDGEGLLWNFGGLTSLSPYGFNVCDCFPPRFSTDNADFVKTEIRKSNYRLKSFVRLFNAYPISFCSYSLRWRLTAVCRR